MNANSPRIPVSIVSMSSGVSQSDNLFASQKLSLSADLCRFDSYFINQKIIEPIIKKMSHSERIRPLLSQEYRIRKCFIDLSLNLLSQFIKIDAFICAVSTFFNYSNQAQHILKNKTSLNLDLSKIIFLNICNQALELNSGCVYISPLKSNTKLSIRIG